jgi:hypothetical protein
MATRRRLGCQALCSPKEITICEDENFHQAPCLVGIEPVSNYILLEKYASDRTAEQWTTCVRDATKGMKLEVVQSTSDEGKGILRNTRDHLAAHHSPDPISFGSTLTCRGGQQKGAPRSVTNRNRSWSQLESMAETMIIAP